MALQRDYTTELGSLTLHRRVRFVVWFPIVSLLAIISGYLVWQLAGSEGPFDNEFVSPPKSSTEQSKKNIYSNPTLGFTLEYPDGVSTKTRPTGVYLEHSLAHEYTDPCDFKDGKILKRLVDFNANLEILHTDLAAAVFTKLPASASDLLQDGTIKAEYEYSAGSLRGFKYTQGVEGCGMETYFFPLDGKILVVERKISPERTPLVSNYDEFMKIPGIFTVAQEEEILLDVLSSFKQI